MVNEEKRKIFLASLELSAQIRQCEKPGIRTPEAEPSTRAAKPEPQDCGPPRRRLQNSRHCLCVARHRSPPPPDASPVVQTCHCVQDPVPHTLRQAPGAPPDELVLEPQATSALQVTLGELSLVLVPEALLSSGGQGPSPAGLEHGAFRNAPGHEVAVEQGFFCASVPEVAAQEEAYEEDADPEFLTPGLDPAAGSVPGLRPHPQGPKPDPWPGAPTPRPKRRSPLRYFSLDAHLLEPFPSSPLQPLPPSPSPGPQVRPQRPPGPSRKARRRLFRE
ncbi:proline-rich protein 23C-like [Ursus maritimus]|uniref:Proline-rich protein 23C-like n=1 Tax=Ursus maritimus TaxID=29073 RepID=A0A384DQY8_URSMA|nr:proline-rich protein 23C-like [Ursus maritimus]